MTKREMIEEALKKKKFEDAMNLIIEFIDSYPFELDGYYFLVQAKTKNFSKKIDLLFDENKEENTLNLITELKEIILTFDPKDKKTEYIEDYILELTKQLNIKIEGKPERKPLSDNIIAFIITSVIIIIILLIIFI